MKEVNWNPGTRERRAFARMLALGVPVIALVWFLLVFLFTGRWVPAVPLWILVIGESLALVTWSSAPLGKAVHGVWFFLVCLIETVLTTVLLGIVFYGVITPVGLIQRAFGRRFLRKRGDPAALTYWRPVEEVDDPRRYYRQF
ncbi:MAG: hypothetical protein JJU00_11635 [Opitutales bacterium]|nr:hypothetical protein [Opitutales bacterium]